MKKLLFIATLLINWLNCHAYNVDLEIHKKNSHYSISTLENANATDTNSLFNHFSINIQDVTDINQLIKYIFELPIMKFTDEFFFCIEFDDRSCSTVTGIHDRDALKNEIKEKLEYLKYKNISPDSTIKITLTDSFDQWRRCLMGEDWYNSWYGKYNSKSKIFFYLSTLVLGAYCAYKGYISELTHTVGKIWKSSFSQ